ncbi:MAG: NTP transferase domain-containing protein, partial [Pseudonocardiaceae bacterium]
MTSAVSSQPIGITGLILAGGQGSRMGHVDKGLQAFRGKPMVAHVLARFAPQVNEVLINANRNLEQYARLGYRVVADEIGGFAGPLAGLERGLAHA